MKHKVFGSVFILAIALGMISVAVRTPQPPPSPSGSKAKLAELLKGFNITPQSTQIAMTAKTDLVRPLSSYQVRESGIVGGMDFHSATYTARVSEQGFTFGSKQFTIELGAPRIVQNGSTLECAKGDFAHPTHGVGEIRRGAVIEKYVFENSRAEQIFTLPQPVGTGAMEVRIPVKSTLPGPVVAHDPMAERFDEIQFQKGGLAFKDATGATKLAYHSAIAMDASGLQQMIAPRFENGEIVLPVSKGFMDRAQYPVVVDPWFDLAGSGSGGGISNNGGVSDRPAMCMTGGGLPYIAWADSSAADSTHPNNTEIYVVAWNGSEIINFGGSNTGGGISSNTGRSTNPSICLGAVLGLPMVAWQDDSNGYTQIYCKVARPNGGFVELAGSASGSGISRLVGPSQHPSIASLVAQIPGLATEPPKVEEEPVIAYEDATFTRAIRVLAFYPGQPSSPVTPPGWYQLTPNTTPTSQIDFASAGDPDSPSFLGVSEYPTIIVDPISGNPVVAWQETQDGNYEIYVKTYTLNSGFFLIRPNLTFPGYFEVVPNTGVWTGISGSAGPGGISNTAGMSQYPSIAIDLVGGTSNISVAWQESLPAAPPGATSQIYLRRSINGGAWNELAGSASGLGISQSTKNATAPSVAAGGNYVAVAWADDATGNPEIYARRFSLSPLSTQWEQIGFQGSAFPAVGADVFAPPNGISKTPNYSLTPIIAVDIFGDPTVAWMDGTNATFDVLLKQFAPNGPGVTSGTDFVIQLRQTQDDPTLGPGIDVPAGGTSSSTTVFLSSRVFTETLLPAGTALRIEVEVKPTTSTFTGTPNAAALIVAPDSPSATPANLAVVPFSGLPNFNYKWQARTVDQIGRRSPWFAFATVGGASFRIDSTLTGGGGGGGVAPPPLVTTTKSKGSCGLLGLDAVALLGALSLLRRRRASK